MLTATLLKQNQTPSQSKKNEGFFFQPRLAVNQPNDVYEHEADAVADRVLRMPDTSSFLTHEKPFFTPPIIYSKNITTIKEKPLKKEKKEEEREEIIPETQDKLSFDVFPPPPDNRRQNKSALLQRKCAQCEEEETTMQRKEISIETTVADASTENYINSLYGKGRSLTQNERKFFESRMSYDFSDVQLHTNNEANQSAKSINALAYTHENNIVFGAGQYQPNTDDGKKLMAHELTHVMQQSQILTKSGSTGNFNQEDSGEKTQVRKNINKISDADATTAVSFLPSNKSTLMLAPVPGQLSSDTALRLSDVQLKLRSNQIYKQAATSFLAQNSKPVTGKMLGILKKQLTVAVLQGFLNGELITLVAGNDPKFSKFIQDALQPGEIFIDSISIIPDNIRTGEPRKSGHVNVHAEQVLAGEALSRGLIENWVASSNDGCKELCMSTLKEFYPNVRHVNPKIPKSLLVPPVEEMNPATEAAPETGEETSTTSGLIISEQIGDPLEPVADATTGFTPESEIYLGNELQALQGQMFGNIQGDEIDKYEERLAELQPLIQAFLDKDYSVELILIVEKPNVPDKLCEWGAYCEQDQHIYFRDLYINFVQSMKVSPIISPVQGDEDFASASDSFSPRPGQGGSNLFNESEIKDLPAQHPDHHCEYAKQTIPAPISISR
jgi:hypothetical protein